MKMNIFYLILIIICCLSCSDTSTSNYRQKQESSTSSNIPLINEYDSQQAEQPTQEENETKSIPATQTTEINGSYLFCGEATADDLEQQNLSPGDIKNKHYSYYGCSMVSKDTIKKQNVEQWSIYIKSPEGITTKVKDLKSASEKSKWQVVFKINKKVLKKNYEIQVRVKTADMPVEETRDITPQVIPQSPPVSVEPPSNKSVATETETTTETNLDQKIFSIEALPGDEHGTVKFHLVLPDFSDTYKNIKILVNENKTRYCMGQTVVEFFDLSEEDIMTPSLLVAEENPPTPKNFKVCVWKFDGKVEVLDQIFNFMPKDLTPPENIYNLSGKIVSKTKTILVSIKYPMDTKDYYKINLYKKELEDDLDVPVLTCDEKPLTSLSQHKSFYLDKEISFGKSYVYGVCVYDKAGNNTDMFYSAPIFYPEK